jgi:hypothetical protein
MPDIGSLVETRARRTEAIADAAAAARERPELPERLMVIAADHTARGMLDAGGRSMRDRGDLLDRLALTELFPNLPVSS